MSSPSEPDILTQFFRDAGVPDTVLVQAGDPNMEDAILAELEAVSRDLPQGDTGTTRIIIRGRHIRLGEASWKLLTSLTALAISTVDPTGITKLAVLKEGFGLLKELRPLFKKLDEGKLLVCSAIAAVRARQKQQGMDATGASRQDIAEYFTQRNESEPVKLDDILKALEKDNVVKVTYPGNSDPLYAITF